MRQLTFAALAALWGLALPPGVSAAPTADGTLITNVACATFQAAGGQGFAVSYCVTAIVRVDSPCIALQKIANPTVQSSGGTVTFSIYVVNCSCTNSAFNIMVTDRLPDNMSYSGNYAGIALGFPGTWTPYQSSVNTGTGWSGVALAVGQGAPYYMRYILDFISPCKSALVTFTANVI